jgi:hypothetical protein
MGMSGAESGARRAAWITTMTALMVAVAILAVGPARAAMYKWVDEKGIVHYTDTLPPEAVDKARTELNKQGVTVKQTDKALTPEQRRAIEQDSQRRSSSRGSRRKSRAAIERCCRRTRASGDRSRAKPLAADDQQRRSVDARLQRPAEQAQGRGRGEERGNEGQALGRGPRPRAREHRRGARATVELIAQKKRETDTVIAKYDADKQRWRELVASRAARAEAPRMRRRPTVTPVKK